MRGARWGEGGCPVKANADFRYNPRRNTLDTALPEILKASQVYLKASAEALKHTIWQRGPILQDLVGRSEAIAVTVFPQ